MKFIGFSIFLFGQLLAGITQAVIMFSAALTLNGTELGIYSLSALGTIAAQLLFFGPIGQTIGRFAPLGWVNEAAENNQICAALLKFTGERIKLSIIYSTALLFIGCFLCCLFFDFSNLPVPLFFFLTLIISGMEIIFSCFINSLSVLSSRIYSKYLIGSSALKIFIVLSGSMILAPGPYTFLSTVCAASASAVLYGMFLSAKYFQEGRRRSSLNEAYSGRYQLIKSYYMPFIIWAIPCWIQASVDKWIITYSHGAEECGKFHVLHFFSYFPLSFLATTLSQYTSPRMFSSSCVTTAGKILLRTRVIYLMTSGTLGICLYTLIAHSWGEFIGINPQMAGEFFLIFFGFLLFFGGQIESQQVLFAHHAAELTKPKIISSVAGVFISLLLTPALGVIGSAISILFFGAVSYLMIFRLANRKS